MMASEVGKMRGSLRSDTCFTKDEEEKAMACSAADLSGWTDFPKGLKVLLLDDDAISAAEMSSKLEGMGYIVTLFTNENEAIEAISNRTENFHVAIVEVNTCSSQDKFRFLEMARGLPTVMISSANCLNTMMKCIALGAVEFLQRPLSDDKLRNIWQHVVHKAFNGVLGGTLPKSLEPVKETVASMLRMGSSDPASSEAGKENTANGTNARKEDENLWTNDRLPAPSTPQLEQGSRVLDDGDCQDQVHCSMEHDDVDGETRNVNELSDGETLKDSTELMIFSGSESKLVDNASSNSVGGVDHHEPEMPLAPEEGPVKEEVNSSGGSESGEHLDVLKVSDVPCSTDLKNESNASNPSKKSSTTPHRGSHSYSGGRSSKKKTKVDWTPELHRRFVQAVEQLGIDQAIPSKILELMRVEGLTRHNVASHLQKYRMHRRHVLPKCEERRWPHHRDSLSRVYAHRPFVPIPPTRSSFGYSTCPVWGHPNYHPSSFPMGSQTWYPSHGSWPWKSYTRMYADAWGCPALSPQDPYSTLWTPQSLPQNRSLNHSPIPKNLFDLHLGEEVIDDVVKEAISKPWLPLPLGLKPPSTDSVLAELNRQGIRSIPPPKCNR